MSDIFYFLAVVGGPALLFAALFYAVIRTVRGRMRRPQDLREPAQAPDDRRPAQPPPSRGVHAG